MLVQNPVKTAKEDKSVKTLIFPKEVAKKSQKSQKNNKKIYKIGEKRNMANSMNKVLAPITIATEIATSTEPLYVINIDAETNPTVTKGNSKLGKSIWNFSTLPGNKDHLLTLKNSTLLTNIPGTCSKYCEACFDMGCYACKSAKVHHNAVVPAWGKNTLLLRQGTLFAKLDEFITNKNKKYQKTHDEEDLCIEKFRIDVSGEVESVEQFESWDELAAKHPEVTFCLYTKNFDDLDLFMQKHKDFQQNLVVNVSQWHGAADAFLKKYPGKFNVFEYDDSNIKDNTLPEEDKIRLASLRHCRAVLPNGKHAKDKDGKDITCDQCTYCYHKSGKTTAVYAH